MEVNLLEDISEMSVVYVSDDLIEKLESRFKEDYEVLILIKAFKDFKEELDLIKKINTKMREPIAALEKIAINQISVEPSEMKGWIKVLVDKYHKSMLY